jgi:predicted transcriptional regulator
MLGFRQFLANNPVDEQVLALYLQKPKMTISEIAQYVSRSEAEIYRILHNNNVSPNRLKANHQKVYSLSDLGWGIREIAEFTGYTPRNVRYILARERL